MALLNINPMLLMTKPTGAELTFLLLMVVVSLAGKVIPQMAKNLGEGIHVFNNINDKK